MKLTLKLAIVGCLTYAVGLAQDEFFEPTTTIGGYGELHYNHKQVGDGESTQTMDFHRFIIFYSHAWTEKWSFKSEVELEHNYVKDGHGELELEQAYVNYHSGHFGFQVGVILPSVGLLNEYHEPPLFLSVERPEYAKYIVPTTWFGNGVALYGKFGSLDWRAVVMEGLNGDNILSKWDQGIRGGRQKGFKSNAKKLLYNFRIAYTGLPGLRVGGSFSTTEAIVSEEGQNNIGIQLSEVHAKFDKRNIMAVFEWGNIQYTNHVAKSSTGYYLDLGYNISSILKMEGKLIPWVRISDINPGVGHESENAKHYSKWMVGLTYKPIDKVAFKVDYAIKTLADNGVDETTLINLGVGYNF